MMTHTDTDEAELARLGIKRIETPTHLWSGYRYSSARDVIAAAKLGEKS